MDVKEILKHVDHTLLLQPSTWEEIKQICDDAMEYGTASVCIPPSYVKQAAEYMNGKMAVESPSAQSPLFWADPGC